MTATIRIPSVAKEKVGVLGLARSGLAGHFHHVEVVTLFVPRPPASAEV